MCTYSHIPLVNGFMQVSSPPHTILKGHSAAVLCVAVSFDSKVIASGCVDKTIKLWDKDKQSCTSTLTGHTQYVWGLDFSRDDTKLVSCSSDESIKVWDITNLQSPALLCSLASHTSCVNLVKFSPDGTKLASCSDYKTVKIWDVSSFQLVHTLEGHWRGVNSVAWSPDSRLVASGGADETLRVWDVFEGTQVTQPLEDHDGNHTWCVLNGAEADKMCWSVVEARRTRP